MATDSALSGCPPLPAQELPCGGQRPAHARGVSAVSSFGQGTDPQQGSPVEAAACRTGAMGQGQGLDLVQVSGFQQGEVCISISVYDTKKYSMQNSVWDGKGSTQLLGVPTL